MSQTDKQIVGFLSEATRTDDPSRLRWLAARLEGLGAWEDARIVRGKALDKEREQADYAAWHKVRTR